MPRPRLRQLRVAVAVFAALGLLAAVLALTVPHAATASPGAAKDGSARAVVLHHATTSGRVVETSGDISTVSVPGHRAYLLLRPPGSTTARRPMVVLLHGTGITALRMMQFSGFAALARADHFLLVAPQSLGPTWNSGDGCCGVPAATHLDDTAFVRAVIADARARASVDPSRIYLVGYSSGGKLSYDVACAVGGELAATATYGAGPQLPCTRAAPHAAFVGYGDRDTLEPITGKPHNSRGAHQPAAATVAGLRHLDGCSARETEQTVGPALVQRWASCAHGTTVEYVRWANQTHHFPIPPGVPTSAAAATLMWQFFGEHVRTAHGDGAAT